MAKNVHRRKLSEAVREPERVEPSHYDLALAGRTLGEALREVEPELEPEPRIDNAFGTIRTLLITIKSSMLAIDDFEPIEDSENNALQWQTISDAVAKIRAILGGTTFGSIPLELQRLLDPRDLRRLLELLEEIDEIYHLDDPTGPVGPPVPETIKRLNEFIWSHAEPSSPDTRGLSRRTEPTEATSTEKPDGPFDVGYFRYGGVVHELQPIPWKLLNAMWQSDIRDIEDVEAEVWDALTDNTEGFKRAKTRVNEFLKRIGHPKRLSQKRGGDTIAWTQAKEKPLNCP